MKHLFTILLSMLILSFVFTSCKKDENEEPEAKNPFVATWKFSDADEGWSVTYTSNLTFKSDMSFEDKWVEQGTLEDGTIVNYTGTDQGTYSYTDSKITIVFKEDNATLTEVWQYKFITDSQIEFIYSADGQDYTFVYNKQ
jgi:hypothetical protein